MNPTDVTSEATSGAVSAGEVSLVEQLDNIIHAYSAALDSEDWAQVSELDRNMKELVERALSTSADGALPVPMQERVQVLAKLNQRALALAGSEREKVARELQDLANAKAGASAYADNAKL